jgi:hypothetical protein
MGEEGRVRGADSESAAGSFLTPSSARQPHLNALPLDGRRLGGSDRAGCNPSEHQAADSPPPRPSPIKGEGADAANATASARRGRGVDFSAGETWHDIAPLLDRLGARLGLDALSRLAERESHIPERASIRVPAAAAASQPEKTKSKSAGAAASKPPRPVRLFAPPEPIAAASWLLPDDPPFRFTWRRRAYRVSRADGPERIAEEWWTANDDDGPGAAAAARVRDYYRVEDADGRRFWLFRAGLPGDDPPPRWFVHGVFA